MEEGQSKQCGGLRLWVVYCCLHGCVGVGSSRHSDERDKNISALTMCTSVWRSLQSRFLEA